MYNSLKGLKKWGETTRVKKWGETTRVLGRNDFGAGAKRLGIKFGAKRLGANRLGRSGLRAKRLVTKSSGSPKTRDDIKHVTF